MKIPWYEKIRDFKMCIGAVCRWRRQSGRLLKRDPGPLEIFERNGGVLSASVAAYRLSKRGRHD